MSSSRRTMLILSGILAGLGIGWQTLPSSGVPAVDSMDFRFIPRPDSPKVSFAAAKKNIDALIQAEINTSQDDFGVKYSESQIGRIRDRVWDTAQLALVRNFRPIEQPSLNE